MRAPALVLLLALAGPGAADVVCGLACAQHRHHAAGAESRQGCHEHESAAEAPEWSVAAPCHDRVVLDAPFVASAFQPAPEPAVHPVPATAAPIDRARAAILDERVRPPDILLISTQLRV